MARLTQLKKVVRSKIDNELDEAINKSLQDALEMDIDFLPPDEPGNATQQNEEPDNTQDDADEDQDHADEEQNNESTQNDD
eukprot:gene1557-1716_t